MGTDDISAAFELIGTRGVRDVALRALERVAQRDARVVNLDGPFVCEFFKGLSEATGIRHAADRSNILMLGFVREPMQPFAEFVWWLVRMGYAIPSMGSVCDTFTHITRIVVTPAGHRFIAAYTAGEHFLAVGFIQRVENRCPGIPDDVLTHLEDARQCLEHDLPRPSIVLTGLAYEICIEKIGSHLMQVGKLQVSKFEKARAAERIDQIKAVVPNVGLASGNERPRVERALDFAHQLRERRNDGSHSKPDLPFSDPVEIEEFLLSACRHLPSLWLLNSAT